MDSIDTPDNIGRNFMHQRNDEICIGENAKVTQHDQDLENSDEGDDEEHIEVTQLPIMAVNIANNNVCIHQSKNVLSLVLVTVTR